MTQETSSHRVAIDRRTILAAVPLTAAGILLSGCTSSPGATNSRSFTFANSTDTANLNPALTGLGAREIYFNIAYDSLTWMMPDGTITPQLATAWQYVGSGNTAFELTIRSGVSFSNGELLTAQAVADSLLYQKNAHGPVSSFLSGLEDAKAAGDTVRLTMSSPNPDLPALLSQFYPTGAIIAPAGVKDPGQLGTRTLGAGPYVLNQSATVPGNSYVYTPNEHYWDKSAVHWDQVTVQVMSDNTSAVQALRTGQVQAAIIDSSNAVSLRSDSLRVAHWPAQEIAIVLADRSGSLIPALGNLKVRQALNYAVNRASLAKSLYGDFGSPANQVQGPGWTGYLPSLASTYSYDPAKAKQLLSEAGYASGFSMTMLQPEAAPNLAQAVVAQFGEVGVNVTIKVPSSNSQFISDWAGGTYPSLLGQVSFQPAYTLWNGALGPTAPLNPRHMNDPQADALAAEAASIPSDQSAQKWEQLYTMVVQDAWTVPLLRTDGVYFMNEDIALPAAQLKSSANVRDFVPATS